MQISSMFVFYAHGFAFFCSADEHVRVWMPKHFLDGAYCAFQHQGPVLASRRLLMRSKVCTGWTEVTAKLAVHEVPMPWACRDQLGDRSPRQGRTQNTLIIHISALHAFFVSRKNCTWKYWATRAFTTIEQLRIIEDLSHTMSSSNDAASTVPPTKRLRLKDHQYSRVDAAATSPSPIDGPGLVMVLTNGENFSCNCLHSSSIPIPCTCDCLHCA
jgi:hypothetical protein